MDLVEHFQRYRDLVFKDRPAECTPEYIEHLAHLYPKVRAAVDRLNGFQDTLAMFRDDGYAPGYFRTLNSIRESHIEIFEQAVEDRILSLCYFDDDVQIHLARNYGWNYYKFVKLKGCTVHFKPSGAIEGSLHLLPRYAECNRRLWENGELCVDADEAAFLDAAPEEVVRVFIDTKRMYKDGRKFDTSSSLSCPVFLPVDGYNFSSSGLMDWTLHLEEILI